jgi:hypothetical protein
MYYFYHYCLGISSRSIEECIRSAIDPIDMNTNNRSATSNQEVKMAKNDRDNDVRITTATTASKRAGGDVKQK